LITAPAGSAAQAGGVRLTSGTIKTTPVAGDSGGLEYDGTSVSIINSAGARKTFFYTDSTYSGTITSGQVTTALGFTPYNATNPSGYITSSALTPYAPLASPALSGTPTSTTAAVDTNTTQIATTAFVIGQAGSVTPVVNGTAAVGTSLRYARQDHVHPTDTTRAPLASPTFTGLVITPAGTASQAGGIKITSGTLKTTPVAGDSGGIEYDGTTTYIINSAGVRKTFAYTDSNITGSAGSITGTYSGTISSTQVINGLGSQTANTVFAAPNGSAGNASFRALVAADIPSLTASKISDFDTQVRTNRLDQMAAPTASVSLNSQKITSLLDPTSAQDAATKNYVDNVASGLDVKQSVIVATTANIALTALQTIDGVSVSAGNRVLVKNQTAPAENGIYVASATAWTRATDMDAWTEFISAFFFVEQGTTQADTGWVCTVDLGGTVGTTGVTFAQFSSSSAYVGGAGLTLTGNTFAVGAGTGITVNADDVALTGQALALHNLGTNGIFVRTGAGTVAARSIATSGNGISASNADGVAGNPTLTLSNTLAAPGGLTMAADQIFYYSGASTAVAASLTSFGRSLIDDADAATARTTLGLGTIATQAASNVNITGGSIDAITFDGGTF
jgi:hypothetical protein